MRLAVAPVAALAATWWRGPDHVAGPVSHVPMMVNAPPLPPSTSGIARLHPAHGPSYARGDRLAHYASRFPYMHEADDDSNKDDHVHRRVDAREFRKVLDSLDAALEARQFLTAIPVVRRARRRLPWFGGAIPAAQAADTVQEVVHMLAEVTPDMQDVADALNAASTLVYNQDPQAIVRRVTVAQAAAFGILAVLRHHLRHQPIDSINTMVEGGCTPLVLASTLPRNDAVQVLLDAGVRADAQISDNRVSALHVAAASNSLLAATRLLAAGADSNAANRQGFTVLHAAVMSHSVDVLKLLLSQPRQLNINARDQLGYGAVHFAVSLQFADVLVILHAAGADLNASGPKGRTPMHMAVSMRRSVQMIKLLCILGADVDGRDRKGRTPLHRAIRMLDTDAVKHLYAAGADFNAAGPDGYTAIQYAIATKSAAMISLVEALGGNKS